MRALKMPSCRASRGSRVLEHGTFPSRIDRDRCRPTQVPAASRRADRVDTLVKLGGISFWIYAVELEPETIQPQMAQGPMLRGEVGGACVAREVSVERGGMGERGCARRLGEWVWV